MELALYNGAAERPRAGRRALLLRQPAREPRRASPLDLASLPLLPAEHRAARRLARPVRLFDRPGRGGRASLHRRRARAWRCGGVNVTLSQATQYPWDGTIDIAVDPERAVEFALRLRIPAWCRSAQLAVNGAEVDHRAGAGSRLRACPPALAEGRRGRGSSLDMPAERIYAHPEVAADVGRVALKRGPIVYCLEGADNDAPLHRIALPRVEPHRSALRERPARRRRHADGAGGGDPIGGGGRALPHRSAGDAADDAARHSVQLLEQPRVRRK